MQPIVDRLETEFKEQIAVERRNGSTAVGQATMAEYGLRAHPSYIIVTPEGKALWSFTGQTTEEILRKQMQTYVSKAP